MLLSVQKVVCLWSLYGWTFVEVSPIRCFFGYIGDNPVRVWIRNRTGENTQKVSFRCTPARGLNKVILKFAMVRGQQMPTPTKKSQQPSKWVLMTRKDTREGPILFFYEVSTDVATEHATNLSVWVYGNLLWKIIAKCRTAPLLSNVRWKACMHMLSPWIQIPLTFYPPM